MGCAVFTGAFHFAVRSREFVHGIGECNEKLFKKKMKNAERADGRDCAEGTELAVFTHRVTRARRTRSPWRFSGWFLATATSV